jgi:hypothetical protein
LIAAAKPSSSAASALNPGAAPRDQKGAALRVAITHLRVPISLMNELVVDLAIDQARRMAQQVLYVDRALVDFRADVR